MNSDMHSAYRWLIAGALFLQCCSAIAATRQAETKGDPRNGEQIYARCMACHSLTENRIGPRHCGVFGRRAGSVPGFDYSPAMRRAKIVWNEKTLERFLTDPMKAMPGTAMVFSGVPDRKERADVIAWLKQASSSPATCPAEAKH
jgi:cytochrome c